MRTDHMNSAPTLSTTVSKCLFFSLFFPLTLWLYLRQLPYLEMRTDLVNTTPMLPITVYIMSILFFSFFFLIFWLYFHYLPYFEMCTDHVNSTPTLSTTVYTTSVLFFSFFPDFLTVVMSITILGNAHRPCKQLSNITTPSLFFSWIFSYFFHLKWQNLPYLAIFSVYSSAIPFRSIPGTVLVKLLEYQNSVAGVKFWLVNSTGMAPESAGMTRIWQEYVGHH